MNAKPIHPLHLLDDLLASLAQEEPSIASSDRLRDGEGGPCQISDATGSSAALAEAKQDLVLRAADDLFRNNVSLLENALALLDEQEQYQRNHSTEKNESDNTSPTPVIRKIRAKRSGREAILVRKQRKKPTKKSRSQMNSNNTDEKKEHYIMDDYYFCLLGRDGIERRALLTSNVGHGNIHRQGAHCTCRSFFQNIKGGTKRSEAPVPSTCSNNIVVCKHLLAAILMHHLPPWSRTGVEAEIVDDRKFAKLAMGASIG